MVNPLHSDCSVPKGQSQFESEAAHQLANVFEACAIMGAMRPWKYKRKCGDASSEAIREAIETSFSMWEASRKVGMSFTSFKRDSQKLGLYKPNPGRAGRQRPNERMYTSKDILAGKHPFLRSTRVKHLLVEDGILKMECSECGLKEKWKNKAITLELDHVNGDSTNHTLKNLRILCPNCHSQTETYRSGNRGKSKRERS